MISLYKLAYSVHILRRVKVIYFKSVFIKDQAARLVELGLDRTTRPYAAIQAIAESFKIMSNNIADRENREELREIKTALDRLEGSNTFDIYAESEN